MSEASDSGAPPPASTPRKARRAEDWTAAERLEAVIEASKLSEEELGAFLRREGLHEADLEAWRAGALDGIHPSSSKTSKGSGGAEAKRLRELEKELRRKDRALAEATALVVLSKKVRALWGDEGDDTGGKNEP